MMSLPKNECFQGIVMQSIVAMSWSEYNMKQSRKEIPLVALDFRRGN